MSTVRAAPAYSRLVPATLLPPEDPSDVGRRSVRDWFVDVILFVLAVGLGLVAFTSTVDTATDHPSDAILVLDVVCGVLACALLWMRRSRPFTVGALTALLSVASAAAAPASVVGLFTVAVHRRGTVAVVVVAVNLAVGLAFPLVRPQQESYWVAIVVSVVAAAVVTAWGMFVRARRQLVWTLRERAERAEAEQRILADQARLAERTRIAREMHDVLAHRISLIALHAGGLQVRPELPDDQVRETAGLLRATAQRALEELRGVIGVLRDEAATGEVEPSPPQPTLRDLPRLVADTARAGAKVTFTMDVPDDVDPPAVLGRDAYRIVQEALTNVAKHAGGTATTVQVSGAPGAGLQVTVRNLLPVAAPVSTLPGSGSGLLGLRERVSLSGGTLEHGPTGHGEFVVDAHLTWTV